MAHDTPANRSLAVRRRLKRALALAPGGADAPGLTMLIYHRIGGGTRDERDLGRADFGAQMDLLAGRRVLPIDTAVEELAAGDDRPKIVVTFDDGFADVHAVALPLLVEHNLPFTVYLTTAYVGGQMDWEGSTASGPGPALSWDQIEALRATGLCTIGNHTHTHVRPERLDAEELDRCTATIEERLGVTPQHFAYTWGVPVPAMEPELRRRFRSAATGEVGRNHPGDDLLRLRRVPVRQSDPLPFFAAKLTGRLLPERAYGAAVALAKRAGRKA